MNETISCGDVVKVSEEEFDISPAWYIPHYGVYHPQKPGKIRVVFGGSAKYEGVSLDDNLFTGPELTNNLIGVLCRFRKGPVEVMCDIERMFHHIHVKKEDQDYLRFLWRDDRNFQSEPSVYRMTVHLEPRHRQFVQITVSSTMQCEDVAVSVKQPFALLKGISMWMMA